MGGKESKEPVAKYGLLKHYVGNDIVYQPVAAPDGSLLQPRNSTLIFLHDHGENPQMYIDTFMIKASKKVCGFEKLMHVVSIQAPIVIEESEKKGRRCAWNTQGQDLMQSQGYQYVQQIIEREIGAMGGRADRLFIAGVGVGGHIAVLSGFYSQHIVGGVFCLDTTLPDSFMHSVSAGAEAAAIFPLYEAKKNMFICLTKWKASLGEDAICKAKEQAQVLRGNGFCKTSLKEFKKSMSRAINQVHNYSRLGSQFECDRMNAFRKARTGDFDKQALAKNGPALGATKQ